MRWFWGRVEEGKREVGERETLLAKIFGEELKWKYGEQVSNSNINFSSNWCDNTLSMGPTKSLYLPSCHWTLDLNFWKLLIFVFSFHHSNSNFWVLSDGNITQKTSQTTFFFVRPTSFGPWVMETRWYHSVLCQSKQPLNSQIFASNNVDALRCS